MSAPRGAAVAGIVFSALLLAAILLLRLSVPLDPLKPEAWLQMKPARVILALNLIPFAGIAFLWFIGVLRDRLGAFEDRFFGHGSNQGNTLGFHVAHNPLINHAGCLWKA